jgi:hypothetical protein
MVDVMDFRQEARGCLRLAEAETQAELKTILMGMALGWLTFANQVQPLHDALGEELVEGLAQELDSELAPQLAGEPVDELAERRAV